MGGKRVPPRAKPDVPLVLPPHVRDLLGDEAEDLLSSLRAPAPVSIRLNPLKPVEMPGEPVHWCNLGRYLPERPVFTLDPLFHAGAYYVQEASSMLLEQAFRAAGNLPEYAVVLDLCAAPGGKSTHLAALLPPSALLISNEPVRQRQAALLENLWKWGRKNVVVTGAEPDELAPLGAFCDLIAVDAPCSGEGMFRKDPHARRQWGANLVETCATRQQHILDRAWAALKPGGHLIYSTCTWETCENEDHVERMAGRGAVIVPIAADPAWGVLAGDLGLRCYPHRVRGEGFFIALLRKPQGDRDGNGLLPSTAPPAKALPIGAWLKDPLEQVLVEKEGTMYAIGYQWAASLQEISGGMQPVAPGIPVAVHKGGAWLPHPALALNELLREEAFPTVDLDRATALRYLRGEALPAEDAAGTVLVRHQNLPIGWANGAGKRLNNRWPAPWRIRMR